MGQLKATKIHSSSLIMNGHMHVACGPTTTTSPPWERGEKTDGDEREDMEREIWILMLF
jgi:hypothetical protein